MTWKAHWYICYRNTLSGLISEKKNLNLFSRPIPYCIWNKKIKKVIQKNLNRKRWTNYASETIQAKAEVVILNWDQLDSRKKWSNLGRRKLSNAK